MNQIPYKHISVLVMPTDYCNMNCVYCFNSRREQTKSKTISMEVLQKLFEITIPHYEDVKFIWHGGEPTSMGVDFYRQVLAMQQAVNKNRVPVENSIQTNLTLMDPQMAQFFVEKDIGIGSSIDGLSNHLTRHNTQAILRGRDTVLACGGRVGFICVVQKNNVDSLIADYEWFKSKGINYTLNQYLPIDSPKNDSLYVEPAHYAQRICQLFDHWLQDRACNIRISYFQEFVDYILFGRKTLCCYNSCLGKHIGIHYNGDIYNCNRYFDPQYCYGNVMDYGDIHECFQSPGFENMLRDSIARRNTCRETCEIYDFCTGGCNNVATVGGDLQKPNEYVCQPLQQILGHIRQRLAQIEQAGPQNTPLNPYVSDAFGRRKPRL